MVIVGIDEVGRGCWAGPVTAAAVILGKPIEGVKDSKLLNRAQREVLSLKIHEEAAAIGIGWASADIVNEKGLTAAIAIAMQTALDQIKLQYDQIVIDGNFKFLNHPKAVTIIKADNTIAAVSAASIVAKVARDNYMAEMALKYPNYGFEKHVGYGTAQHINSLKRHGVSEIHRLTYKPIADLLKLAA